MLALIYALNEEIKPLLKGFQRETTVSSANTTISKGKFCGVSVIFCRCGVGMGNANEATKQLLGLYKPFLVISAGYCGALQEGIKSGDLILPTEIRSESADIFKPDQAALKKISEIIEQEKITCHTGPLFSVFKALETSEKKREAGKRGSIGVDMETAAIASVCQKTSTPFVSLRVVFDTVDINLPGMEPWTMIKRNFLQIPKIISIHWKCQRSLNQIVEKYLQSG